MQDNDCKIKNHICRIKKDSLHQQRLAHSQKQLDEASEQSQEETKSLSEESKKLRRKEKLTSRKVPSVSRTLEEFRQYKEIRELQTNNIALKESVNDTETSLDDVVSSVKRLSQHICEFQETLSCFFMQEVAEFTRPVTFLQ